jgi:hypothetical protein
MGADNCKCSRDQQLNVSFESTEENEIINFWSPNDRLALLNFVDRTPERTDCGAIELLAKNLVNTF